MPGERARVYRKRLKTVNLGGSQRLWRIGFSVVVFPPLATAIIRCTNIAIIEFELNDETERLQQAPEGSQLRRSSDAELPCLP